MLEPDRNEGAGEHGVGRIAYVIQNPGKFLFAELTEYSAVVELPEQCMHGFRFLLSVLPQAFR